MAFDFPNSPTENQEFTPAGGPTYVWKTPRWTTKGLDLPPATTISDTPPLAPENGQLWWESDTGDTYIWYDDGSGAQWVQQNAPSLPTVTIGDVPPTSPLHGALWWNSTSGRLYTYYNDGDSSQWVHIAGPVAPAGFMNWPAGVSVDWWGPTAPAGTLLCFGQSLLRADYAALFAIIGTTYGAADGTHFTLPDTRGRVIAGKDNMGGTGAGRLLSTGQGGSVDGLTLGGAGGADRISLAIGHLPNHGHTVQYSASAFYMNAGGGGYRLAPVTDGTGTTIQAFPVGGDLAHSNAQPTIVCNKLITTGGV